MIVWWPWALYDPIKRPLAALRRMSQFMDHQRKMPFAGELVSNYDVDWRYMPHYFGYKLPEFVIILFCLGTQPRGPHCASKRGGKIRAVRTATGINNWRTCMASLRAQSES